mgnify:CR=1 FL=1
MAVLPSWLDYLPLNRQFRPLDSLEPLSIPSNLFGNQPALHPRNQTSLVVGLYPAGAALLPVAAAGLVVTAVVALPAVVPVAASREAASAEVSELVLIVLPNLGQVSESVEALPAKAAAELALAVLPKTDDWVEA